jgi:microcin C transport system substrate-binding protein
MSFRHSQNPTRGQFSGWEGWKSVILIFLALHIYPLLPFRILQNKPSVNSDLKILKQQEHLTEVTSGIIDTQDFSDLNWQKPDKIPFSGSKSAIKGGAFRMSFPAYPPTLRTRGRNSGTEFNRMLEKMVYETLLKVNHEPFFFYPSLANEWAVSEQGDRFFFSIDPEAKWSDGRPVTAADFIATWRLLTDKDLEDPFHHDLWSQFSEPVVLPDTDRRKFMVKTTKKGWRAFVTFATNFYVFPAHIISTLSAKDFLRIYHNKMLPGSGPCEPFHIDAPERIIMRRRQDYWAVDKVYNQGIYNFDKYEFYFVADSDLAFEKFKAGEIDYMSFVQARKWVEEMSFDKVQKGWIQKRRIKTAKPQGVLGFSFNLRQKPFDDKNIRQAFACLWPRIEIIDKLMYKEYEPIDSFFEGQPAKGKRVPVVRFDPDKAAELLADSGWKERNSRGILEKNGVELEVNLSYSGKAVERFLIIYQQELRRAGIVLHLREMTWASRLQAVGEHNFQLTYGATAGQIFPVPESLFHSKYAEQKNSMNVWGYQNPLVDRLCEQFEKNFNYEERIKILQQIDDLVTNDFIMVFCWYAPAERVAFWNKFAYPEHYFGKTGDYRDAIRFWWLDPDLENRLSALGR